MKEGMKPFFFFGTKKRNLIFKLGLNKSSLREIRTQPLKGPKSFVLPLHHKTIIIISDPKIPQI